MNASHLRVYYGPQEESANLTVAETKRESVTVPLMEIMPLLADAVQSQRTWLRDFADDEVTISMDAPAELAATSSGSCVAPATNTGLVPSPPRPMGGWRMKLTRRTPGTARNESARSAKLMFAFSRLGSSVASRSLRSGSNPGRIRRTST